MGLYHFMPLITTNTKNKPNLIKRCYAKKMHKGLNFKSIYKNDSHYSSSNKSSNSHGKKISIWSFVQGSPRMYGVNAMLIE